ncbi:MAG: glycosyltransferase family 4 protein [Vicinamibacteria bacterium]
MTRVLFLTESFHPVLGGGEAHIRQLASRLVATGTECLVLTRRGERGWATEEVLDGVRILRVSPSGPGRVGKYAMAPAALAALARHRRDYDVIVVRGGRVLALPGLIAGRALGKHVVLQPEVTGELSGEIYTWGTSVDRPWVRRAVGFAARIRNRWLRDADAFVAISTRVHAEILAAGVAPERIAEIPHGVDIRRFHPASSDERRSLRLKLGLPDDGPIIVFTGRLLRGKGIDVLLGAFGRLARRHPGARLVLVGSGDGQSLSIEDEARGAAASETLMGRVSFTGRVGNVEDYLRAADVFAFPSLFEAMPLSVIEAAACGLACVASRVGGIPDVLEDGSSGRLVPPGDTEGLEAALDGLLRNADERVSLGAAARAAVLERFDFDASVEGYRALFTEVARVGR